VTYIDGNKDRLVEALQNLIQPFYEKLRASAIAKQKEEHNKVKQRVADDEAAGKDPLAAGAYYKQDLSEAQVRARKYSLWLRIAISKTAGTTKGVADDEMRGIKEVTTVGIEPDSVTDDKWNYYSTINVKFQLLGNSSSTTYRNEVLLPSIRKIMGVKILRIGTLKEL
jgi:hypothetical protein